MKNWKWPGRAAVLVALAASVLLVLPATGSAFAFHHESARDWAQDHYNQTLYSNWANPVCTVMASLSYRKGAGVPWRHYGYTDTEAFWANPDAFGPSTALSTYSPSWVNVRAFRDHFNDYPPAGNDWVRVTRHRCYFAPQEDDRWAGGYVAFYHYSVDKLEDGECAEDYFHLGVIYAKHTRSDYNTSMYGTCKVDRTGDYYDPIRLRNLINLHDRMGEHERRIRFVQVNTLVYNP